MSLYRTAGAHKPRVFGPVVKRDYVRSAALRDAYRLIPCQNCGAADGTVCCAHSNWGIHGKGGHIKADDNRAASLCARCHSMLDQGTKLTEDERKQLWWPAHYKTVMLLINRGLWPSKVPIPDVHINPWPWITFVYEAAVP